MHADNDSYYRIPENKELAAQYLLLYEMSLPYGLDLNNQIDIDKSSTRLIATLKDLPTERILEIVNTGKSWMAGRTKALCVGCEVFRWLWQRHVNA